MSIGGRDNSINADKILDFGFLNHIAPISNKASVKENIQYLRTHLKECFYRVHCHSTVYDRDLFTEDVFYRLIADMTQNIVQDTGRVAFMCSDTAYVDYIEKLSVEALVAIHRHIQTQYASYVGVDKVVSNTIQEILSKYQVMEVI